MRIVVLPFQQVNKAMCVIVSTGRQ